MLKIDRLTIQLPKGFEHRASDIAHQLGDSLSIIRLPEQESIDRLVMPVLTINPQATNREIANSVAMAIEDGMGGKK